VLELRALEAQGDLLCPVCGQGVHLTIASKEGLTLDHDEEHEPEDAERFRNKARLTLALKVLFPSAVIEANAYLDEVERFADAVVVKPDGGILAMHYISTDYSRQQLADLRESYQAAAIQPLFLLDWRRLQIKAIRRNLAAADIRSTELSFLSSGLPLLYFDAGRQQVAKIIVPLALSPLLADTSLRSFGRIHCGVRRHSLSALRVIRGDWHLDTSYNLPLPDPPPLPARLARKLKQLRDTGTSL